jgi:hypothetical protein
MHRITQQRKQRLLVDVIQFKFRNLNDVFTIPNTRLITLSPILKEKHRQGAGLSEKTVKGNIYPKTDHEGPEGE